MKTKKLLTIFILFFIYVFPLAAIAEEIVTDVLIVIEPDKILAFSGRNKEWVPQSLKLKEEVYLKRAHGMVNILVNVKKAKGPTAELFYN